LAAVKNDGNAIMRVPEHLKATVLATLEEASQTNGDV